MKSSSNATQDSVTTSGPTGRLRPFRCALLLAGALALVLVGTAFAAAKPKKITPKIGEYVGTAKGPDGMMAPATAKVFKEGGKLFVDPVVPAALACGNGQTVGGDAGFAAPVRGTTYHGTDTRLESPVDAEVTTTMSIKFTSATAFSGTVSKESPATGSSFVVGPCSSGTVSFKLHMK